MPDGLNRVPAPSAYRAARVPQAGARRQREREQGREFARELDREAGKEDTETDHARHRSDETNTPPIAPPEEGDPGTTLDLTA